MDDLLSSPDPLNDSPTYQSPTKTRRSSRVRHSFALDGSSPTKQTFELDVGNRISPQKIRVTVQAGNSDMENGFTRHVSPSPARRPAPRRRERTKTTTTTVPVKGLSDSEDDMAVTPKKTRGRPRKSFGGAPIAAKKRGRPSTPTQKSKGKRAPVGSSADGDEEEDNNFRLGQGVEIGRGKGRSRSRSVKGTSRKSTPARKQKDASEVSSTTSKRGRGRRKTLLPDEVVVLEDNTSAGNTNNGMEEPEMNGALSSIDANVGHSQLEYATIRSTTTTGGNEPDITIAIFDPGNETPRRPGWSSPRIVNAPSSPVGDVNSYPSPQTSLQKPSKSNHEYRVAMVPVSPEKNIEAADEELGIEQEEENDYDDAGGYQEYDTILESEEFSMISVDSVPSLRGHLSSPLNQTKEIEPIAQLKNKNIRSVQELDTANRDNSFSSIPEEILKAATPKRKAQNPNLLTVQNAHMDDSFSSLAPDVLEAATPGRDLPRPKPFQVRNLEPYEDSFSAIPTTVLEAATPAPLRKTSSEAASASTGASIELSARLGIPGKPMASTQQNGQGAASLRLLTPDETPSPTREQPGEEAGPNNETAAPLSTRATVAPSSGNDSSIFSQMRSSPPSVAPRRYTYTAHIRQRRERFQNETQTPSIVFSSPSLPPPPIQFVNGHPVLKPQPQQEKRPKLAPTVRAGRLLQDLVVPLSSPRSRAQSLGSPFKSPIADRKSSLSVTLEPFLSPTQERRPKPTPRLGVTRNRLPAATRRGIRNNSINHDDPSSNHLGAQERSPSPDEKNACAIGFSSQRGPSDPRLSAVILEGNSMLSDDAMSWQAEDEVHMNDATTSMVNHINSSANERSSSVEQESRYSTGGDRTETWEHKWAAERAAVSQQIDNADANEVIFIESDDDDVVDADNGEDEDFGLLLETLNSEPLYVEPREKEQQKNDKVEKPRRSKIPSPWRQNSKRLVYNDELSRSSFPPIEVTKQLVKEGVYSEFEDDLSEFVIPQKANFQPRIRERGNLDLSSLLASSPNKKSSSGMAESSGNIFVPKTRTISATVRIVDDVFGEIFDPIPQKMGFSPRPRAVSASSPLKRTSAPELHNIFGASSKKGDTLSLTSKEETSSTESKPLGQSSPSRSNTLLWLSQRLQPNSEQDYSSQSYDESSSSFYSHGEKENHSSDSRAQKWTGTVRLASTQAPAYTSPTKSCLRSPLKTPVAYVSPTKNVAFVPSSPLPSSPSALSATTWTDAHWMLLRTILHAWKPENRDEAGEKRRRKSTRVLSSLLGKKVSSNGETMKLEQWHLEVVDEFRGQVPGWQEGPVAKRVFALLIGAQKRAQGAVGKSGGRAMAE